MTEAISNTYDPAARSAARAYLMKRIFIYGLLTILALIYIMPFSVVVMNGGFN